MSPEIGQHNSVNYIRYLTPRGLDLTYKFEGHVLERVTNGQGLLLDSNPGINPAAIARTLRWGERMVNVEIENTLKISERFGWLLQSTGLGIIDEFHTKVLQSGATEMHSIDLSDLGLSTIPVQLALLGRVTHLDLSNNLLSSIPEEILKLQALSLLNISGNPIYHLPDVPKTVTVLAEDTCILPSFQRVMLLS